MVDDLTQNGATDYMPHDKQELNDKVIVSFENKNKVKRNFSLIKIPKFI
jgi:hypothetical protein